MNTGSQIRLRKKLAHLKQQYRFERVREIVATILYCKFIFFKKIIYRGFKSQTVLLFPSKPYAQHLIYKVLHYLGCRITVDPNRAAGLVVAWQDQTLRDPCPLLDSIQTRQPVINILCTDISKQNVDRIHRQVFGYSLAIDPLRHHGACVRKSNRNGTHDGVLLQCPLKSVHPDYVYQKIVNNEFREGQVQDIRLTVMKNKVVFCFLSIRPIPKRFENFEIESVFAKPNDIFSKAEIKQILDLCSRIGLDLGVLDVARDQDDGKIYVFDVNNTPVDPPKHVKGLETHGALRRISEAFDESFL